MGGFFNPSKKIAREMRRQMEEEKKLKEQEKKDLEAHRQMEKAVNDDRNKFEQESTNAKLEAEDGTKKELVSPTHTNADVENFKNLKQLEDEDEEDTPLNRIRKQK